MARGKPWTDVENELLLKMFREGRSPQEIYDSGAFPERTVHAILKQLQRLGADSFVQTKPTTIVQTIKPAEDAMSIDEVVKLFSTAFKQICELKEVDKLSLERFRIIFQAAKDYGPLLKFYENWEVMEQRVKRIEELLEELETRQSQPQN